MVGSNCQYQRAISCEAGMVTGETGEQRPRQIAWDTARWSTRINELNCSKKNEEEQCGYSTTVRNSNLEFRIAKVLGNRSIFKTSYSLSIPKKMVGK
jgi:hypothetical protein